MNPNREELLFKLALPNLLLNARRSFDRECGQDIALRRH
jgi:hypothetical protein